MTNPHGSFGGVCDGVARLRQLAASACLLGFTLGAGLARAVEVVQPEKDATEPAPQRDALDRFPKLTPDIWLGGSAEEKNGDGNGVLDMGGTLLFHAGLLTLGAGAEYGNALFAYHEERVSALAGTTFLATDWLRLDALAEAGGRFLQPSTGIDVLGSTEIVAGDRSVTLGYAGIRLGPTLRLGRKRRVLIGAWLGAREDLGHASANYTVQYCSDGWLSGNQSCSNRQQSDRFGGLQFMAGIRFGVEFGKRE